MGGYEKVATGQGVPDAVYLLPLAEIDYLCNCTWVYDCVHGKHRLKYQSTACPVQNWHRNLEKSVVSHA